MFRILDKIYLGTAGPETGGGGITPTGTISITENGTYDVTNYASADVDVSIIGLPREVSALGVYQMPTTSFTFSLPSDAIDLGNYALAYALYGSTGSTSVDLSSLTSITGEYALYNALNSSSVTSLDLSSLVNISGNHCCEHLAKNCSSLTTVNLSSLTSITGANACEGTLFGTAVVTVDLPLLSIVTGSSSMTGFFNKCSALTDVYFRALTSTSFGNRVNQFISLLYNTGTQKTHTLHFPSNMETTIQGLSGYPNFGGTSGYVTLAFDLPATE